MRISFGFRAKLLIIAAQAAIVVFILGGITLYSGNNSSQSLKEVYENNVQALIQLQNISRSLADIRFGLANTINDENNLNKNFDKFKNARSELDSSWALVLLSASSIKEEDEQLLINDMIKSWSTVQDTIKKINIAYTENNKNEIKKILDNDWPSLEDHYIKSLSEVIPLKEDATKIIYDHSNQLNDQIFKVSIGVSLLFLLMIFLSVFFVSRSTGKTLKNLATAATIAERTANGDLSLKIENTSRDEVGKLLQSLQHMQKSLQNIVGNVRSSVNSISHAAEEISHGNGELSSRTEEQAASLEETAASMEELTSTVKQNAENASQANQLAVIAADVAHKGGDAVNKVVVTMNEIAQSSQKISEINNVIDGIAFQTNILALNAAVEAARAGEQGRGFAVVASEVRSLAQRSAQAAKEIKALINDSEKKVKFGNTLVADAGKTMKEIVESVQKVTEIIDGIASASREQSSGIDQINKTVVQLEQVTQQNAALVNEATAAADNLKAQAAVLNESVQVFKLE